MLLFGQLLDLSLLLMLGEGLLLLSGLIFLNCFQLFC